MRFTRGSILQVSLKVKCETSLWVSLCFAGAKWDAYRPTQEEALVLLYRFPSVSDKPATQTKQRAFPFCRWLAKGNTSLPIGSWAIQDTCASVSTD